MTNLLIEVTYTRDHHEHRIIVCDEGEGLPQGFDPAGATKSLGMRVVTSLVQQLDGTIDACNRNDRKGSCLTATFRGDGAFRSNEK